MAIDQVIPPEARRLDLLEERIYQMQLDALRKQSDDHESRIRVLEAQAAKTNVLMALTTGAGLVGLANLVLTLFGGP